MKSASGADSRYIEFVEKLRTAEDNWDARKNSVGLVIGETQRSASNGFQNCVGHLRAA